MYPKDKFIEAVNGAIDFITNAVDGADEEHQESEMLNDLSELLQAMADSRFKKQVAYEVRKKLKERGVKR